jgi:enoyl reductase-like protein
MLCWIFMVQNSFPMREWHVKHMEKTIIKFVTGLSANANKWEKRQHKQYGGITNICKQIDYDIKHGATIEDIRLILQKIRNDSSYSSLQKDNECMQRLNELDKQFLPSKEEVIYVTPTLYFQDSNRKT